jgi:outer membrane protein
MMKTFRMTVLFSALVVFTFVLAGCAQKSTIGVLDVDRVLTESPKVKALQDQLNQKGQELSTKLEADKAKLTPEQIQAQQDAATKEFEQTKQGLEQQIDETMRQSLEQVAQEKKLGIILFKNGVTQGGVDVTQDVIDKMK